MFWSSSIHDRHCIFQHVEVQRNIEHLERYTSNTAYPCSYTSNEKMICNPPPKAKLLLSWSMSAMAVPYFCPCHQHQPSLSGLLLAAAGGKRGTRSPSKVCTLGNHLFHLYGHTNPDSILELHLHFC